VAAVAANDKLVAAEMEGKVVIDRIEFLELFEDVAIAAAEALDAVLRDGQLAMRVSWPRGTLEEGQGRLRRVRRDDAPNWWQRLEIIEDKRSETLRFIATTDRARAEETLATGQLRLADGFIRQASRSSGVNAEVTKTLFEMLLPNRLKEQAPRQADLILLVDPTSARYPWELLEDRWSHGNRPPAVAAGMVRQLKTPRFRPHPAHATEANAFVVGNPDLAGWDKFCDLPGARQEAQKVANLLNANSYFAQDCIDESADSILAGLHRGAWRILHLAGHGEHEFETGEPDDAGRMKTVSGMVIGKNTFLTPGDVEQMRWVPELVFINCCHLGKTGGKTDGKTGGKTLGDTAAQGRLSLLAANLAIQFVEMGVRAVVAAGWAVDDGAAEAFAEAFYTHMLAGETFGRRRAPPGRTSGYASPTPTPGAPTSATAIPLCRRAPTVERLSLLGSTHKRHALVAAAPAARLEALDACAEAYREAFEAGGSQDAYPFTNWASAVLLAAHLDTAHPGLPPAALEEELPRLRTSLQEGAGRSPDFWTAASLADLDLVQLLACSLHPAEPAARGRKRAAATTEACAALAGQILATYRDALARGASPRERASLVENLDALLVLLEGGPPVLGERLRQIRDAI
jgi:hypothetical protein